MDIINDLLSRAIADSSEDEQAWLEARKNGITASDVAQFDEGYDAHRLIEKKLNSVFKGNKWTQWGLEREPYLVEWAGYTPNSKTFHSEENSQFLATPDGYKISDGELQLTQVKTTSKGWAEDQLPENYVRQCQWEMFISGAKTNLLVWETHENFIPTDLEPNSTLIKRDEDVIQSLVFEAKIVLQLLKAKMKGN